MKKILALLLVLITLFSFAACGDTEVAEEGDVKVVIENRDGTYDVYEVLLEDVTNKGEGAYGIVKYLAEREENRVSAEIVDSTYGAYVNAIGSLTPVGKEYVALYTSVEKDFSTSDTESEVRYDGKTLKMAGVGLSSMSVEEGTIILFRIETY